MSNFIEEECERVDSSIFTGACLYEKDALALFKSYLARWERRVVEIEEFLNDEKECE